MSVSSRLPALPNKFQASHSYVLRSCLNENKNKNLKSLLSVQPHPRTKPPNRKGQKTQSHITATCPRPTLLPPVPAPHYCHLVQLGVSCPRSFPNSFPFPTLAPAPPSPTSIGSQVPSSGWRGPGGLHNLSEALLKPRSAGRPRDLRGAGLTPGLGPPHPRTRPLATREGGSWGLRLPEGGGAGDVGTAGR